MSLHFSLLSTVLCTTNACRVATGMAPAYLNSLIQVYEPSRSLRCAKGSQLVPSSLRGRKSQFKLFPCVLPRFWNELQNSVSIYLVCFFICTNWSTDLPMEPTKGRGKNDTRERGCSSQSTTLWMCQISHGNPDMHYFITSPVTDNQQKRLDKNLLQSKQRWWNTTVR